MKRIVVQDYEIAVVYKHQQIVKVLNGGKFWLLFGETYIKYNMYEEFNVKQELDILINRADFLCFVNVLVVPEDHIALHYEYEILKRVYSYGRYVFWNQGTHNRLEIVCTEEIDIPKTISKVCLAKSIMAPYIRTYKVESYESAVYFVDGKFEGILDPGFYSWFTNPTTIHVAKADLRQMLLDVNGQEILTKDKAQIRVNLSVHYRIEDIKRALVLHKEYEKQLYSILQLSLRAYIGQLTLDELMENKHSADAFVLQDAQAKTQDLGVQVLACGMKDIILPGDVKEIMNQVLIAEKRAQANMIMRREETPATRSLLNTAKLMEDNVMLFRLKEMEYVEKIADKINTISLSSNGQILDQFKQIFIK